LLGYLFAHDLNATKLIQLRLESRIHELSPCEEVPQKKFPHMVPRKYFPCEKVPWRNISPKTNFPREIISDKKLYLRGKMYPGEREGYP
jgi:hypothetical protein